VLHLAGLWWTPRRAELGNANRRQWDIATEYKTWERLQIAGQSDMGGSAIDGPAVGRIYSNQLDSAWGSV